MNKGGFDDGSDVLGTCVPGGGRGHRSLGSPQAAVGVGRFRMILKSLPSSPSQRFHCRSRSPPFFSRHVMLPFSIMSAVTDVKDYRYNVPVHPEATRCRGGLHRQRGHRVRSGLLGGRGGGGQCSTVQRCVNENLAWSTHSLRGQRPRSQSRDKTGLVQ